MRWGVGYRWSDAPFAHFAERDLIVGWTEALSVGPLTACYSRDPGGSGRDHARCATS